MQPTMKYVLPYILVWVSVVATTAERITIVDDLAENSLQDGNIYWKIAVVAPSLLSTCTSAGMLEGQHFVNGSLQPVVSKPVCFNLGARDPEKCGSEDVVTRTPTGLFMQWECADNEAKIRVLPQGEYCNETCVSKSDHFIEGSLLRSSADWVPLGQPCGDFANANEVTEWTSLVSCTTENGTANNGTANNGTANNDTAENGTVANGTISPTAASLFVREPLEALLQFEEYAIIIGLCGGIFGLAGLIAFYYAPKKFSTYESIRILFELLLPMLDLTSDLLFIFSTAAYSEAIRTLSILALFTPTIGYFLWLSNNRKEHFAGFQERSKKDLWWLPLGIPWMLLGWLLFLTKLTAFPTFRNILRYVRPWKPNETTTVESGVGAIADETQDDDKIKDFLIHFNYVRYSELLESIPQIVIQSINYNLLGVFDGTTIASLTISCFVVSNVLYVATCVKLRTGSIFLAPVGCIEAQAHKVKTVEMSDV